MKFFNEFVDKGLLSGCRCSKCWFAHLTYTEAIEICSIPDRFEYRQYGSRPADRARKILTERVFNKPVFVTDYPKQFKLSICARTMTAKPWRRLICWSRSRRTDRRQQKGRTAWFLERRMEEWIWIKRTCVVPGLRNTGVKHAGFGLGFERLVMYITGVSNIREFIPFLVR
jgi:asparaginyl-tRNA synthetase